MRQEGEARFNNVIEFAFDKPILLRCIGTSNLVLDTNVCTVGVKRLILSLPIDLYKFSFAIQLVFNKFLK